MSGFKPILFIAASMITCSIMADADTGNMYKKNADCSILPSDQQEFASQLTPANKNLFCSQFSMDQQQAAMEMAEQADVTPDQAVEQIAQQNNMMPMMQQNKGSCPLAK